VPSWPAGKKAYTVILKSLDKNTHTQQQAEAYAASLPGITAGVLDSSQFSSLRPGWWAVWSGQYDTSGPAINAATAARAQGHVGAYARYVAQ
jgi:hypothetical protein